MANSPISDLAPDGPDLTAYDRDQMPTYLRLIDAAGDGADWREAVEIIFGVDPNADLDRARATYDSNRSEEHTSELQSLMRISYAVFRLQKKKTRTNHDINNT